MSRRTWFNDQRYTSEGMLEIDFSFVTNGTSDPDPTLFRGAGGLTGSAIAANGLPNSSPSAVASITRVSAGLYRIVLADGYRYLTSWESSIQDGADNAVARLTNFQNEGQGHTTPMSVDCQVRNMSTAAALETTGRRIGIQLCLKDSGNGS